MSGLVRSLRRTVPFALLALGVGVALDAGCGGAVSQVRRDEGLELHRALAAEEARLAHGADDLEALDPAACPDRCRAAESICDASSRICVIARELGDADTLARCDRAEATCRAAHEATTACGCEAQAADAGTV